MNQRWLNAASALWVTALMGGCDRQSEIVASQPQPHPPAVQMPVSSKANAVHVPFPMARVALSGITIIGTRREAWVSIDKNGPTPYGIGGQVLGAALVDIQPNFVVFESEGVSRQVFLAAAPPQATLPKASDGAGTETGLASLLRPLAPNDSSAMASAPIPQPSQGKGNATFLEAIGKAQRAAVEK